VITRAKAVLELLESEQLATGLAKGGRRAAAPPTDQLGLFGAATHPVVDKLRELNVDGLTPLAALTLLASLVDETRRPG
jgi:hypothetical protein